MKGLKVIIDNLHSGRYSWSCKELDERLYEISSRGPESKIVYFWVRNFANACKISGIYKQQNGKITLTGKIKCAGKEYPLTVQAKNVNEIVDRIIESALIIK